MKAVALPQFTADIADEVHYLAVHASPKMAERWHQAVVSTVGYLAENPGRGHPREDLQPAGICCCSVRGFRRWLIFYRVQGKAVQFLRVKHGSMHLPSLFATLEAS